MVKQITKEIKYHNKRGITLVALVITVIIILILVGTVISISLNQESLFEKSADSAEKYNGKVEDEEKNVNSALMLLEEIEPMPVTVKTSNYPAGWDNTKISAIALGGGRTAPIPTGFVVSGIEGENTIGGGLVIYQLNSSLTNSDANALTKVETEEEHELAMNNLDQFVWIPVDDINQMIMCKKNNLAYTDENEVQVAAQMCNIVYDEASDTIKCAVHNSEDICGRLYRENSKRTTVDGYNMYTTNIDFGKRDQKWTATRIP
ncbi:MAG: hypothetical protein IKP28_01310 [Clostridia bacterium]|nr:hypothetical protein [Clostridia bacterium]